jgi:hypothetical protein
MILGRDRFILLVFVAVFIGCLSISLPARAQEVPTDAVGIGQGFNSITSDIGTTCVEYDPSQESSLLHKVSGTGMGSKTVYKLDEVEDFASIKSHLSVDASISLGWGIFKADAAYNFLTDGSYSSYSSYLFVDVSVRNEAEILNKMHLTKEALNYAAQGADMFLQMCGDEFVYGRRNGGQFTAIVQVVSSTDIEQKKAVTAISQAVTGYEKGKLTFSEALDQVKTLKRIKIYLLRSGGAGKLSDIDGIKEAALHFPDAVKSNPTLATVLIRGYNSVDNLPPGVLSFDETKRQGQFMNMVIPWLDRAYSFRANLAYARSNADEFEPYANADFQQAWDQTEAVISTLGSAAEDCRRHPLNSCSLPNPPAFSPFSLKRKKNCSMQQVTKTQSFEHFQKGFPGARFHSIAGGDFTLADPKGTITGVAYSCIGTDCGLSFHPGGDPNHPRNDIDFAPTNNGHSFHFRRVYYNNLDIKETYTASYTTTEEVCQ